MSMHKVVALPGSKVPTTEPNPELISMIKAVLEHAEEGRLQSFVATGFMADGARLGVWADTHPNVYEMLGSLSWLQAEYIRRHVDEV